MSTTFCPSWSQTLGDRLRGVVLAREKGMLLAWDDKDWLYLLNRAGVRQGQVRTAAALSAVCAADDGSAYVGAGQKGEVWWFAPDLTLRWERAIQQRVVATAVDPFGQYLALSDSRGDLHLFDRTGKSRFQVQTPRPLHYLAFVPANPYLVGAADFGLVASFDLGGRSSWRDGLVAHIGSLAVNEEGAQIMLACYTEGLMRYDLAGKKLERWTVGEPCRLAAISFDGACTLVASMTNKLSLLDGNGKTVATHNLEKPPVALALGGLGERAYVACGDGTLAGFELREG